MKKIALVMGSFHKELIQKMRDEAARVAAEKDLEIVEEVWVPGSVEKPLILNRLLQRDDVDAAVALGIIERGGTKHGMVMGQSLMHFCMELSIKHDKPIGLGVLGPEIEEDQIEPRLLPYAKKAVLAVNDMLHIVE